MYCKDFLNLILGEKSGEYICVQGGYKDMEIKKPAMAGTLESSDCPGNRRTGKWFCGTLAMESSCHSISMATRSKQGSPSDT